MKFLLVIISTLILYTANAQNTFRIDEQTTYVDGTYTGAISLDMKASKDKAKKAWNDYIQDVHGIDIKGYGFFQKKDKLKTDPISITFLSDEKLILNTVFKGDDIKTVMDIYVLKPDGTSLSLERDSMVISNLEVLTEEFVADFLPDYYAERVNNANDEYDDAKDSLKDINEEITDKSQEIVELREEINELKKKKVTATNKVSSTKNSLMKKTKVYEKVKSKMAKLN